jgi:SNF family Na+-dependent transporter
MSKEGKSGREHWSGSFGFILAAAGSAIGLGNIWKFPYITGENGGGAFVIVYLVCILAIGLPVMLCEITMGRKTQKNPVGAFRELMPDKSVVAHLIGVSLVAVGVSLFFFGQIGWAVVSVILGICIFKFRWSVVGGIGVIAGFIILSFYSVVAGWTLGYIVKGASGELTSDPMKQDSALVGSALSAALLKPSDDALESINDKYGDKVDSEAAKMEIEELNIKTRKEAMAYAKANLGFTGELDVTNDKEFKEGFKLALKEIKIPHEELVKLTVDAYGGMAMEDRNGEKSEVYPKPMTSTISANRFVDFIMNPFWGIGCHAVFMLLCVLIVTKGIKGGIEKASKILMPALFVLLVILIIRGVSLPGATEGVRFLLNPDFSKLTKAGILTALGHAFFTLSLGMGAIITYGSYLGKKENLFTASLSIVFLDTLIALMAGLAIFPAVFAMKAEPGAGAGLVFITLPQVFNGMPGGVIWNILFFLLLAIAALTSGISLLEVVTAYFVDELNWSRKMATCVFGGAIFIIGIPCALSCNENWPASLGWLEYISNSVFNMGHTCFLNVLDDIASNWLLPLGGLFTAIFVGWIWGTKYAVDEIRKGSHNFADVHLTSLLAGLKDDPSHNSEVHVLTLASMWGIFIRFISPVAVMIAFLNAVGWL